MTRNPVTLITISYVPVTHMRKAQKTMWQVAKKRLKTLSVARNWSIIFLISSNRKKESQIRWLPFHTCRLRICENTRKWCDKCLKKDLKTVSVATASCCISQTKRTEFFIKSFFFFSNLFISYVTTNPFTLTTVS